MLKNILTITQEELQRIYKFVLETNNNVIIFGPPGVGKTCIAQQVISSLGYKEIYINLSTLEAPDFVGIPQIINGRSSWAPPEFLPIKNNNIKSVQKPVVLLFDEIDKAARELQSPLLEIFQFKSINGKKLNIQAVIATGNRQEDMSFSSSISHALTNRSLVYNVEPDFEVWQKWARNNNINPMIVGFLNHNQDYLLNQSKDDSEYCFPSPRSWTFAANDIDKAEDSSLNFKYRLISGRVGKEAADQFRLWLEHYKDLKPIINKIIYEGKYPNINDMNEERILICAISLVKKIADMYTYSKIHDEYFTPYTKRVFYWLTTISPTYAIVAIKSSLSTKVIHNNDLLEIEEVVELFDKISEEIGDI